MKSDLVDLDVTVLERRERAVHVRDHETGNKVWLPLAQVEIEPAEDGTHHIATMPEWLAIEKELV
jgi:hypothetical protein